MDLCSVNIVDTIL